MEVVYLQAFVADSTELATNKSSQGVRSALASRVSEGPGRVAAPGLASVALRVLRCHSRGFSG